METSSSAQGVLQGEGPEAASEIQKSQEQAQRVKLTYQGLVAARVWSAAARAVA